MIRILKYRDFEVRDFVRPMVLLGHISVPMGVKPRVGNKFSVHPRCGLTFAMVNDKGNRYLALQAEPGALETLRTVARFTEYAPHRRMEE